MSEKLDSELKQAIVNSKQVLAIFTPEATKSKWVEGEIIHAVDSGKTILVSRRNDVEQKDLPLLLQGHASVVFKKERPAESIKALLRKQEWGIPVIIPAAGKASKLYPFSQGMPKVLFPVGNKPILHHIIERLQASVFSKIIILTDHFFPMIEYYASLVSSQVPIECRKAEGSTLPMALQKLSPGTAFLLYYSDILLEGEVDWGDFIDNHNTNRRLGAIGTLMASQQYKLAVGRIIPGAPRPQFIQSFTEKPDNIGTPMYINMAVSIFEPEFLNYVRDSDLSLFGDTLNRAMVNQQRFCFYGHEQWMHIQTLDDWYVAQERLFRDDMS